MNLRPFFLSFFILFLFIACSNQTSIVHDLNERDANEILVLLANHGISASKERFEKNQDVSWIVNVAPGDTEAARSLLVVNRLPRQRQGGLKGICEQKDFVTTAEQAKCRLMLAKKGEIINLLEEWTGVIAADVVLNIPDKQDFPTESTTVSRPTASVILRVLEDVNNTAEKITKGMVQDLVAGTVEGLDSRDVTVVINYEKPITKIATQVPVGDEGSAATADEATALETQMPSEVLTNVGGLKMEEDSAKRFKLVAVMFLVLFFLLTAAFIFVLLKLAKVKKTAVAAVVEEEGKASDQKLLENKK